MSLFSSILGLAAGIALRIPGGQGLGFFLLGTSLAVDALNRPGGTPAADEQSGTQREMVLDPAAHVPVVYGRAIVAPRLAYVTTSGASLEKLYLVCVLCEGIVSAIEEIYLDGNCALTAPVYGAA